MKILLAEDDLSLRQITGFFMKNWGYECDIAPNGRKAVEFAKANEGKYDLCLMDINMPVMNGCEATEMIRQQMKYMPIMALTANFTFQDKYVAFGMDDFLEKPYDPDILYAKINELTVKSVKLKVTSDNIYINKEIPMNQEELKELKELKKNGLTNLKLVGTEYAFVVHKNIQNKISYDLIGEGKELSEFIDRSEKEPGRCHLYRTNLHITKDLFIPEELKEAIQKENQIAIRFDKVTDKKMPE